ncbi:flagellar protein [Lachnospiraceae bacterium KM106-2]|nr:flagellar protein [Lachnospiraceae bacterium KM106-2]
MDVRNCRNCGKLFNYLTGVPICPACQRQLEDKFAEVKQYIYDNPGASVNQVSDEMEVTVQQIRRWIREERLTFSEDSSVGIECENCGKLIKTGRFCKECKDKLANNLNHAYQPEPVKQPKKELHESARMRFLQ